jgi:hypothetical protein
MKGCTKKHMLIYIYIYKRDNFIQKHVKIERNFINITLKSF